MATELQLDAQTLHEAIDRLANALGQRYRHTGSLLLLGIANGGVVLAQRLASRLRMNAGTIDISFHRDDIGRNPIPKEFAPTFIPTDVNGASVVLVDDVLHSGRTVKAALDELFDHGRPKRVELAILIDRAGRRLPVAPTYCGLTVNAGDDQKVVVHLDPSDPDKDFLRIEPTAAPNLKSKI